MRSRAIDLSSVPATPALPEPPVKERAVSGLELSSGALAPNQIASYRQSDGVRVSTVRLFMPIRLVGHPTLRFETMVFGGPLDEQQERYPTREEAIRGHQDMVQRVLTAAVEGITGVDQS
jgi:hypothetical protein